MALATQARARDAVRWDLAIYPPGKQAHGVDTDGGVWAGTSFGPAWELMKFLQIDEWNELILRIGWQPARSFADRWIKTVRRRSRLRGQNVATRARLATASAANSCPV